MTRLVEVNGFYIYPFTNKESLLEYLSKVKSGKILIALNAEKLMNGDKQLRSIVNSNIGYADGIGAVFALNKVKCTSTKIPGVELWLDIIKRFKNEKTFYFIGSNQHVITNTITKIEFDYPGIKVVGYSDGYFDEIGFKNIKKHILVTKPDVVFVAMGSPKQEYIMFELQQVHKAIYMGLGGSFDVYTGVVKRAPLIFINNNLEWAYRLFLQPYRFFRQINLVKYYFKLLFNQIQIKKMYIKHE